MIMSHISFWKKTIPEKSVISRKNLRQELFGLAKTMQERQHGGNKMS
jgi:hypothetical protein